MTIVHYLAYGSNLHPLRLAARVPSARAVGVARLPGRRLAFHKRSLDGSGKCLLYDADDKARCGYGVLYAFDRRDKPGLDRIELAGGGYGEQILRVPLNGQIFRAYFYAARDSHVDESLVPYHWYKRLVLAGARHHGLPADYVAVIAATPARDDPDERRAMEHEALLRGMGA